MYTWSQQRNLKVQAPMNMEGLLRRNMLPHEIQRPNDLPQHASAPLSNVSTVNTTLATLRLQEELDALKRQNQEAILRLLAQRSNVAATLPTVGSSHHPIHDCVTTGLIQERFPFVSTNKAMPESPPTLSLHVSRSATEILEKQRQDMVTKHQIPDEMEVADPKPKRPLSAYNIFFQQERQKIMQTPSSDGNKESAHDFLPKSDSLDSTAHSDVSKKRKRYEPHGKISFETMGKTIAKRWKETLSDETKIRPYHERAKIERERYFAQLERWKRRQRLHYNSR